MEKIKTGEVRRGRGRPKLDAHITEEYAPSRRQALNKMYMYEGVHLLSAAATEIQNGEVLWREDRTAATLKSRDGILEQLGRMAVQDKLGHTDCVYLANLAIAAVQNGYTTREVEVILRKIRMAAKSSIKKSRQRGTLLCAGQHRGHSAEHGRYRMKTEKRPVEITVAGELPGFEYGGRRGVFLNLGLDVEMDGVTYHLSSSFAEKAEMGEVIDTTELERNGRRTA